MDETSDSAEPETISKKKKPSQETQSNKNKLADLFQYGVIFYRGERDDPGHGISDIALGRCVNTICVPQICPTQIK